MSVLGLGIVALAVVLLAAYAAVIVYAIVQICRTDDLTNLERLVWALVVIAFPFLGSIVWFVGGPHPFGLRLPAGRPD